MYFIFNWCKCDYFCRSNPVASLAHASSEARVYKAECLIDWSYC